MADKLTRSSPTFKAMWKDNNVLDSDHFIKDRSYPVLGTVSFEAATAKLGMNVALTQEARLTLLVEALDGLEALAASSLTAVQQNTLLAVIQEAGA